MGSKEELIREQRTIEAMKKGYMGTEGKFAQIVRMLGTPILRQGTGSYNRRDEILDADYWLLEDTGIDTMPEDENSYPIGYSLDGLTSGINLVITIMEEYRDVTVRWNDRIVYKEHDGVLDGFVPEPEWEFHIDKLLDMARKKERKVRIVEREQKMNEHKKRRSDFLDRMREKWGL